MSYYNKFKYDIFKTYITEFKGEALSCGSSNSNIICRPPSNADTVPVCRVIWRVQKTTDILLFITLQNVTGYIF